MKFSHLIKSAALILAFIFMVPQAAFAAGAPKVVFAQSNTDFAIKSAEIQKIYRNQSGNQPQALSPENLRVLGRTADMNFNFRALGAQAAILAPDGRFILQFKESDQVKNCLEKLSACPEIVYAERDAILYTNAEEESEGSDRWGVAAIEADIYAQHLSSNAGTVTVAIVDSGAAPIPAISGRTVAGYDFIDNDDNALNDTSVDGHGTFIAGIVADCSVGTGVKVMPVRVIDSKTGNISTAVNGIYYAVDNGADVINLSLGGVLNNCKTLDDALAYAEEKGVVAVVCSGNAKTNTVNYCPAHNESAITVSALDSKLEFAAGYSNYGDAVDVCAPGTNVVGYATDGTEKAMTGTSMSAGFVSAAAAMIRLQNPGLTPAQVQSAIKDSCKDLGAEGFDIYYGYGIPGLSKFIDENESKVPVESITAKEKEITLEKGETKKLEVTVTPANASDKRVIWSTSDADVATVSADGTVIAKAKGTAVITAVMVDGGFKAQITVTVTEPEPVIPEEPIKPDPEPQPDPVITGISLKKAPETTGYTYKTEEPLNLKGLEIEVSYSDGNKLTVTDTTKFKISGFDPKTAGEQTVTVDYEGFTAEYTVTVQYTWWQWIIRILLLGFIWY